MRTHGLTLATGEDHERLFSDSVTLLRSVRSTLSRLLNEVEAGEDGSLKEITTKQAELETALRRAFEAEGKWNDWQAKNAPATQAAGADIDFAALRHDIACRLERVRECCQDG